MNQKHDAKAISLLVVRPTMLTQQRKFLSTILINKEKIETVSVFAFPFLVFLLDVCV